MRVVKAEDIQERIDDILDVLRWRHVIGSRIVCVRSFGSKANAYARIWNFPLVWQVALDIGPFYVIEVLSEHFDNLPEEEKTKVLIHELLHIPKRFTGGLVPHKHRGGKIDKRAVNKIYKEYKEKKKEEKDY